MSPTSGHRIIDSGGLAGVTGASDAKREGSLPRVAFGLAGVGCRDCDVASSVIAQVPDDGKINRGRIVSFAHKKDLAIALQGEPFRFSGTTTCECDGLSVPIKRRIKRSVNVVTRSGKVLKTAAVTLAGNNDFPVRLQCDSVGSISRGTEISGHDSVAVEGGIEPPVAVVSHQSKIRTAIIDTVTVSSDDNFSVTLHFHRMGTVFESTNGSGLFAIAVE